MIYLIRVKKYVFLINSEFNINENNEIFLYAFFLHMIRLSRKIFYASFAMFQTLLVGRLVARSFDDYFYTVKQFLKSYFSRSIFTVMVRIDTRFFLLCLN